MKQRGFTLIELMVALVVLLVLTTMAVPSFMDYMQKARVRGLVEPRDVLVHVRGGQALVLVAVGRDLAVQPLGVAIGGPGQPSFGIAPDGQHVTIAGWEQLFSLFSIEGVPGLTRSRKESGA